MKTKKIKLTLMGLAVMLALGLQMNRAQADDVNGQGYHCRGINVPISLPNVPGADHIFGELCMPLSNTPATVLFLVHSTWYNHREWDPPQKTYSYVRAANRAGYATFAIDRLGTGQSSRPASNLVGVDSMTDALHQVITALRNGSVGDHAFSKVVWIGSSFGSEYGWLNATKYPGDVDAFVLNGLLHFTKATFADFAIGTASHSVCDDPIFKHQEDDCGYITNIIGMKGDLYYYKPFAAPGMLEGVDDFVLRDMVTANLLAQSLPFVGIVGPVVPTIPFPVDPDTSPSRNIHVPTLINLGDHDQIVCGPPDGVDCTHDFIQTFETPYFGVAPDVYIAPNTGHALTLHLSGPETYKVMNDWIDAHVGAN